MKIKIPPHKISPKIPEHPSGMILAFSLLVLLLISLMGIAIISNTQTELNISSNTTSGRDTFIHTDGAARMSAFFGHLMFSSFGAHPNEVLRENSTVAVNISETFTTNQLNQDYFTRPADHLLKRYVQAGNDTTGDNRPHIIFMDVGTTPEQNRIFATSALAIDDKTVAGSLDSEATGNLRTTVVATTIGRNTRNIRDNATGIFIDDGLDDDNPNPEDAGPFTIITIMFRIVQ